LAILLLLAAMVAVVAFIVYVERSERRIPVQYARRVVDGVRWAASTRIAPAR
jgi:preprotein translocase subunit SecY